MGAKMKALTLQEKEFCRLQVDLGFGYVEAARMAFGIRCEPKSKELQRIKDLMKLPRIKKEILDLQEKVRKETEADRLVKFCPASDIDALKKFAYDRFIELRDDTSLNSSTRFAAVKALEKLHDPATDFNLIMRWVEILWRFARGHCPSCHSTFPLYKVRNASVVEYRETNDIKDPEFPEQDNILDTRLELLRLADRRRTPHKSQLTALAAPERHIVGKAAARAGKSALMAMLALMGILLPGVEIWLIARIYEDAGQEADYLRGYLKSLFHPFEDKFYRIREDKMNGELVLTTRWNSVLKIRSAKSKGSLTARELELALIAEPGWVDESVFEEVRARMSSRLGRILAFGTPKGATGILARLIRTTGRDPDTGKMIRLKPEDRLMSNGCPWDKSMLIYDLNPRDNPEYVQSELEAARFELTDEEYASEFEGKIVTPEGSKFPGVTPNNLRYVPRNFFAEAKFILGIDQGPKNFGVCLTAYDGEIVVPCYEFFDSSEKTMSANLKILLSRVPVWISQLGGSKENWKVTITDRHPPIQNIILEMAGEGLNWPTEIIEKPINNRKLGENWRRECQEFVNEMAKRNKLIFHLSEIRTPFMETESPGASVLHDQVLETLDKPEIIDKESGQGEDLSKGWIVRNPWRGDHVLDAWIYTMWTIMSGQVAFESEKPKPNSPMIEHQNAFDYGRKIDEARDLGIKVNPDDVFESTFGRKRTRSFLLGRPGYYANES